MTASAKEVISDAIHLPSARKCDEYADAILAALDSAGYVVVPREPTDEMVVAGDERIIEALNDHTFALRPITPADDAYRAMIAAQESKS